MSQLSPDLRFGSRARLAALLCLLIGSSGGASAFGEDPQKVGQPSVHEGGMAHMSGHMYMTSLRSQKPGDQQKAEAIVAAAKSAMAPYEDYHKALADGYEIFLPNIPQPQYHFTKYQYGIEAWSHFDPLKPTSLLYKKTPEGEYKIVGAMYTDRVDAHEEELNDRIPLSVARWHQHINFCKAPADQKAAYFGPHAKFGLLGSITTREGARRQAASFILTSSDGWSTFTPMRRTRRKSGPRMMMTRDTTTWITPRCRG